jgi:hypothetical protein
VAETLRRERGTDVELVDGGKGEFSVSVDGQTVARKDGDSMPSPEEVLEAVRKAAPTEATGV